MSLNCTLTIKNGQSRGVLEPSFQVVFRIVSQNANFIFGGPKLGEKGYQIYSYSDDQGQFWKAKNLRNMVK